MSTTSTQASEASSARRSSSQVAAIELETQTGVHSAQFAQGEAGWGLTEPDRHYESDGLRHSPDGILQREPVLA